MRIGLLAPPWMPVPPGSYGGTEGVVDQLARGLAATGQQVRLYALEGSSTPVPTICPPAIGGMPQMGNGPVELRHVIDGYDALADCDLIHDHTITGPAWALACRRHPVVVTCHGPIAGALHDIYRAYGRRLPLIAISHDQTARAPDVRIARVIHHGLDPVHFTAGRGDGHYLLFLGRMTPEKGVREAVEVARRARCPLKVAAKMREPRELAYFAEQVEPLLGDDIEYLGEVDDPARLRLLGEALALLNPIRWAEPFGLVMIEALACGTPVITRSAGAAPEIVQDGVTGFLCADDDALVDAVRHVGELDRTRCRAAVRDNFTTDRMVDDHLRLYEEMLAA
ncbi:glycosyltransferase family 4 protein [Frankia sp. QA3]|uniref:glycosyltransferase family 4 protein n=1 Tax=Frankia sp. QA3 TaxID=710111 RepID=UPI000269CE59|nr:glycosyltransferase family 4 protein [Frankia sp. QA3]EIV96196.1 glycosyltransferase [Frankia sp. QA3]